jgi:hypothetical protein
MQILLFWKSVTRFAGMFLDIEQLNRSDTRTEKEKINGLHVRQRGHGPKSTGRDQHRKIAGFRSILDSGPAMTKDHRMNLVVF